MLHPSRFVCAAAASLGAAAAANAQVEFRPIANTHGNPVWQMQAATPDLAFMVGHVHSLVPFRPARWTPSGEFLELPLPPSTFAGFATGISADGQTVVGWGQNGQSYVGFRWTAQTGTQAVDLGEGYSSGRIDGISADGSVLVGYRGPTLAERATLWRPDGPFEIPLVEGYVRGWGTAVNTDGSAAVGYYYAPASHARAYRWTQSGGTDVLSPPPGWLASYASHVSADGGVVLGSVQNTSETRPFRWTEATGMQLLDSLGEQTFVYDMTSDGAVLVGKRGPGQTGRAFCWSEATGYIDIPGLLAASGVDLTGWELISAHAIADDGVTVAGLGYFTEPAGERRPYMWTATIPAPPGALLATFLGMGCLRRRRDPVAAA